jgi:hypothetical protein
VPLTSDLARRFKTAAMNRTNQSTESLLGGSAATSPTASPSDPSRSDKGAAGSFSAPRPLHRPPHPAALELARLLARLAFEEDTRNAQEGQR